MCVTSTVSCAGKVSCFCVQTSVQFQNCVCVCVCTALQLSLCMFVVLDVNLKIGCNNKLSSTFYTLYIISSFCLLYTSHMGENAIILHILCIRSKCIVASNIWHCRVDFISVRVQKACRHSHANIVIVRLFHHQIAVFKYDTMRTLYCVLFSIMCLVMSWFCIVHFDLLVLPN